MIILDYKDARPIYEQIVERFKQLILVGALKENEKLPSVRALAMDLSINPNTIQRAFTELEHLGFIYSIKGRGNFVANRNNLVEDKKEEIFRRLSALVEESRSIGITAEEMVAYIKEEVQND